MLGGESDLVIMSSKIPQSQFFRKFIQIVPDGQASSNPLLMTLIFYMGFKIPFYFSALAILLLSLGCFLSISPALGKPAEEDDGGEEDEEGEGDEDGEANEDEDAIFILVECVCV